MKTIMMMLLMVSLLTPITFTSPTNADVEITNVNSSDTMYYNRYDVYKSMNGNQVITNSSWESGSFEIYGNVIKINRGTSILNYFIDKTMYDELNQSYIYEIQSGEKVIFDVVNRTLTVDKNGEGTIFRINSNIKSNW